MFAHLSRVSYRVLSSLIFLWSRSVIQQLSSGERATLQVEFFIRSRNNLLTCCYHLSWRSYWSPSWSQWNRRLVGRPWCPMEYLVAMNILSQGVIGDEHFNLFRMVEESDWLGWGGTHEGSNVQSDNARWSSVASTHVVPCSLQGVSILRVHLCKHADLTCASSPYYLSTSTTQGASASLASRFADLQRTQDWQTQFAQPPFRQSNLAIESKWLVSGIASGTVWHIISTNKREVLLLDMFLTYRMLQWQNVVSGVLFQTPLWQREATLDVLERGD